MTYGSPLVFVISAAAVMASLMSPSRGQDGPGLVGKTLYTSDVQYRFTRSPDNKALSVLFDNFGVALAPGMTPVATRVLPLTIPVMRADKGATVRVQARGGLVCPDGAACRVIVWVNGRTDVLKISPNPASPDFSSELEFSLPGGEVYQAVVILIAEREIKRNNVAAMISVDSLDLTIAPLRAP